MTQEAEEQLDALITKSVNELEAAVGSQDADKKVAALKAVRALINPVDETYDVQKGLAAEGGVDLVVQLLEDGDEAVVCDAANTLRMLVAHSSTLSVKLRHGREVGYALRPDQVSFNPVQGALEDCQGVRKLVNHLFGASGGARDAAYDALMDACSYNHENKLAFLRVLLNHLLEGRTQALELLDTLLAGLEVTDDAAVVLDQALIPVLKLAKTAKEQSDRVNAVVLLGTVCEERPAAATFLVEEGVLKPLAEMVIGGDTRARDAAVHTMFQVIRRNKRVLQRGEEVLGVEGSSLVQPLIDVVQGAAPAEGQGDGEPKGFDSSDEAALILKALAEQDPAARERVDEWSRDRPRVMEPRCTIA